MTVSNIHSITQADYKRVTNDPWFILATDPFHDYEVPIAGLPDRYSEATAVRYIKMGHTITKPAGLLPGETWSANIATLPLNHTLSSSHVKSFFADRADYIDMETSPAAFTMGTINVSTSKDNILQYPSTEVTVGAFDAADPLGTREYHSFSGTDGEGLSSMSRLIAGGFEVHNDTAELYKSGSVTTYTMPQKLTRPAIAGTFVRSSLDTGPASIRRGRGLPPSAYHARQLRNSHTFSASQGCLVPFRMELDSEDMDFQPINSGLYAFPFADGDLPTGGIVSNAILQHGTNNATLMVRGAAIETSGAFFTGLHESTVLTLTMKFYVEVAPTFANPDLLSLCSPPAQYDPMVLRCYDHCVRQMKAGVPVSFNDAGEWWRMILKTLRSAVPSVVSTGLKAIAPEASPLAGLASLGIQKAIDKAVTNSQNRSDRRKQSLQSNKPPATSKPTNQLRSKTK
jgi:hypothetical protein